jgi:TRAP-type mannitol/chloroaromatic compound transport system permease small subunit
MAGAVKRFIQHVSVWLSIGGGYMVMAMMALTVVDVLGRGLFRHPIAGAYEVSEYMLVVCVLLGISYAQQVDAHPNVPLLVSRFRARTRLIIEIIMTFLSLVFFVLMTWRGVVEALVAFRTYTVSEILRIPAYPFRGLIALGSFLLSLELLFKLVGLVAGPAETGVTSKEA